MQKTSHGMHGTLTYSSWFAMKQRCQNPRSAKYPSYGAVGISVCAEWQSFEGFYRDMGERPDGHTLDRIDARKGYEPGNCKWATPKEQSSHISNVRMVEYRGEAMTLTALSEQLGVNKATLDYRISSGWPEQLWGAKRWKGNRSRQRSIEV